METPFTQLDSMLIFKTSLKSSCLCLYMCLCTSFFFLFAVLKLFNSCNEANLTAKIFKKTGMHSSRMRTARLLTVSRIQGGLHPGGFCIQEGLHSGAWSATGGLADPQVCLQGVGIPPGHVTCDACLEANPPPPWTHKHLWKLYLAPRLGVVNIFYGI